MITYIILIGIIVAFYYNTLEWMVTSWVNNPYYSHGFIVPIISGYVIWNARRDLFNIEKKQSQYGVVFFGIGIITQIIAVLSTIRFLSGISLVITIFGAILYLFGWEFINRIKFPILFLLLAVPIPIIDIIGPPMQTISAVATSWLSNIIGLPVHRDGLILNIPTGSFEVALECSGLNSVISLLTISMIYGWMLEGGLSMRLSIMLSSIPLAMMGNILRITSVLAVANKYGQDIAANYFHDFSSLLLFSVVLIGLFLVGRCFGRLKFKKIF